MKKRTIVERPGWDRVSAVRADHIYEIKSTYILQPGPAALTEGRRAVAAVHRARGSQITCHLGFLMWGTERGSQLR